MPSFPPAYWSKQNDEVEYFWLCQSFNFFQVSIAICEKTGTMKNNHFINKYTSQVYGDDKLTVIKGLY